MEPERIGIEDFGGCMIYEDQEWGGEREYTYTYLEFINTFPFPELW